MPRKSRVRLISSPATMNCRWMPFRSSAIVWMRGILQHEYGVPLNSIEWLCELDETVDFTPRADFKIKRVPADASIEQMLADGEIDALLHPDLIRPLLDKDPRVA